MKCLYCSAEIKTDRDGYVLPHDYTKDTRCIGSYQSLSSMTRDAEFMDMMRGLKK